MRPEVISLFKHYPLLKDKLPYVSLGEFPTPINKLERLGNSIGIGQLYIKRDDLSGKLYGGNKVRKLEFLLGKALEASAREVLTFGGAGSNHALATALYAQQVGLRSISMLSPQPNAHYVRRNLLMSYYCGAELHYYQNTLFLDLVTRYQILRHKLKHGYFPQVIPLGGSSPLGTIGFVNAAYELREQVMAGQVPEPDCIYVALGSTGTAVGLILGLKAVNLKSQVIPVKVIGEKIANVGKMVKLFRETNSYLNSLEPSFPKFEFDGLDIDIKYYFSGERYALFTREGMQAVASMEKEEGFKLEGTYTGKTFAALIGDAKKQALQDKVVLFWNTYNSRDFSDAIANVDYHQLPQEFHHYFEEDVQPLDRHP